MSCDRDTIDTRLQAGIFLVLFHEYMPKVSYDGPDLRDARLVTLAKQAWELLERTEPYGEGENG